jgi:pyruvate dehydrogenase E2 component (dihydrolipoamide acetyltransferase)
MPTDILMPALSPTMEKGHLTKWLKKEGEKINSGDVIAEIETDKATMDLEAVDDGTLVRIVVPQGTQNVAVNSVIAVLAAEGGESKFLAKSASQTASPQQPAKVSASAKQPSAPSPELSPAPKPARPPTPAVNNS